MPVAEQRLIAAQQGHIVLELIPKEAIVLTATWQTRTDNLRTTTEKVAP